MVPVKCICRSKGWDTAGASTDVLAYSYVFNNNHRNRGCLHLCHPNESLHCCGCNLYGWRRSRLAIFLGLSRNRLWICLPRFLAMTDDPFILGWMVSFSEVKCRFSWATNEIFGFSTNSEKKQVRWKALSLLVDLSLSLVVFYWR